MGIQGVYYPSKPLATSFYRSPERIISGESFSATSDAQEKGLATFVDGYFVSEYEKDLFLGRYKDPGNPEEMTWEGVFRRVAKSVADTSENEADFYDLMATGAAIPSSPQLWNYGASRRFPRNGSSCFTGRMGDTLDDFRRADGDAENIYVASGGFGVILDTVRPRGCKIRHCSEGAMGSMCFGGPARRIEGTTGYITGSGRARGALMLQLSDWHPDVIEFILAKRPSSLGWLDDWRANVTGYLGPVSAGVERLVMTYGSDYVFKKDWPFKSRVIKDCGEQAVQEAVEFGILKLVNGRLVPQVYDWDTNAFREANRDWDLPMQNCNMSVRCSDEFMNAVITDGDWTFRWFDQAEPKAGELPWTKTDALGEGLKEYDGTIFTVCPRTSAVTPDGTNPYRYGVIITTWEGLRDNMAPNKNHWRDTDYARFYRTKVLEAVGHLKGRIKARQVWNLICENAHNHADPGIVFSSTYERFQPVDSEKYGPRLSNPCSEYVNSPGGSCNLISVNLRRCAESVNVKVSDVSLIDGWDTRGLTSEHDWTELAKTRAFADYLKEVGHVASRCLTYIAHALEYNEAPVEYIQELTIKHFRTVGVGIMGLAEAMMFFHVKYGSECGQAFASATMSEVALACWERSFELGAKGWPKPEGWSPERMERIFSERWNLAHECGILASQAERWSALKDRVAAGEYATHTCVTSVAPTGSISQIAQWIMTREASDDVINPKTVTSGCEPTFFWGVKRRDNAGQSETYHDLWYSDEHHEKPWMVTAMDGVTPSEHVRMQAAVCAFTCMSVSKTINLPESATVEDVANGYMLAWQLGVPGTSLYRDNSKPMQVLSALECPSGECALPDESE